MKLKVFISTILFCFGLFVPWTLRATDEVFDRDANSFFQSVLEKHGLAGLAVVIVENGDIAYSEGFGFANMEESVRFDPEQTAFQIASVSKVFTSIAAMKEVQAGRLALDEDVQINVPSVQLRNPFPKPVTLRQLLSHTAGIDERQPVYILSRGERLFDSLEPLESYLTREMPPVVRMPGRFYQYSTFGTSLAGLLVEKAAGIAFATYMEESILAPLGMSASSYGMTSAVLPRMAVAYRFERGMLVSGSYVPLPNHPSGSICATARDMGKFLQFLLSGRNTDGMVILDRESLLEMRRNQRAGEGETSWVGLGLLGNERMGHRTFEFGGMLPGFQSFLSIMPDAQAGVFVVTNTTGLPPGSSPAGSPLVGIVDFVYGGLVEPRAGGGDLLPHQAALTESPAKLAGFYAMEPYGKSDFSRLKSVLFTGRVDFDRTKTLHLSVSGKVTHFIHTGNGLFQSPEDGSFIRFQTDENGPVFFSNRYGEYEKIPTADVAIFRADIIALAVFVGCFFFVPFSLLRKRGAANGIGLRMSVWATSCFALGFSSLYVFYALCSMRAETGIAVSVLTPLMKACSVGELVATGTSVFFLVRQWTKGKLRPVGSVFATILVFAGIIQVVFMIRMNAFALGFSPA